MHLIDHNYTNTNRLFEKSAYNNQYLKIDAVLVYSFLNLENVVDSCKALNDIILFNDRTVGNIILE